MKTWFIKSGRHTIRFQYDGKGFGMKPGIGLWLRGEFDNFMFILDQLIAQEKGW